jgi:hypothetical protein
VVSSDGVVYVVWTSAHSVHQATVDSNALLKTSGEGFSVGAMRILIFDTFDFFRYV